MTDVDLKAKRTTAIGGPSSDFWDCIQFLNSALHDWAKERSSMSTGLAFNAELEEVVRRLSTSIAQFAESGGKVPDAWPAYVSENHVNQLASIGAFELWMAFGRKERAEIVDPLVSSLWAGAPKMPAAYATFKKVSEFLLALSLEADRQEISRSDKTISARC